MKRTPISGADLVRSISRETGELPPVRREPVRAPSSAAPLITATEQVNFRCSAEMARLLAIQAASKGSMRLLIATLLREAGHDVPEVDLLPPPGRRRI